MVKRKKPRLHEVSILNFDTADELNGVQFKIVSKYDYNNGAVNEI